jgi:hypothetical protein
VTYERLRAVVMEVLEAVADGRRVDLTRMQDLTGSEGQQEALERLMSLVSATAYLRSRTISGSASLSSAKDQSGCPNRCVASAPRPLRDKPRF